MKKAKIMLMSIAVLATVGSALAFKVAKKGITSYCILETTQAPDPDEEGACPTQIDNKTAVLNTTTNFYYTTLTEASCEEQKDCSNQAEFFDL